MGEPQSPLSDPVPESPVDPELAACIAESCKRYVGIAADSAAIFDRTLAEEIVDIAPLAHNIHAVLTLLAKDSRMLMGLTQAPHSYVDRIAGGLQHNDAVLHGVGSMIYGLKIGMSIGFSYDKLMFLGLAAILQNLGLAGRSVSTTADATKDFELWTATAAEDREARIHRLKLDEPFTGAIESVLQILHSQHQFASDTEIDSVSQQYAMVLHISSVFVYFTRNRADNCLTSSDAMRIIRGTMRDTFHPQVIKRFFDTLTVYPIGSYVRLSSKEYAKIVATNPGHVMRPVVLVVLDESRRERQPPLRIDLREHPMIYIKQGIVDDELCERFIEVF